jgi:uncharacterized membrane protein (DUF106 family)
MLNVWEYFDPYLLVLYKITGVAGLDGLIGTFLVALLANVIGEFTISIAFRINREHLDRLNNDLEKYSDLSQEAQQQGDEASYKALNKQANDAYGQVFFNRFGLSAASLWPAFFALDWIQRHFGTSGIGIPFYPSGVNYVLVFLCCYILARMVFGRVKRHLPYFKGQHTMLLAYGKQAAPTLDRSERLSGGG